MREERRRENYDAYHNRVVDRCRLLRTRQAERCTDWRGGRTRRELASADIHVCRPTAFPGDGIGLHLHGCQRRWHMLGWWKRTGDLSMEWECVVGSRRRRW